MDPRTNPDNLVFGKHITYFEEPDIIYMRFAGAASDAEGMELLRRQKQYAAGRGMLFFLIDASDLGGITPGARKAVAETLKDIPLHGMAIYSAPLKAKVLIKILITAVNLFRKDAETNPVEFFDSEQAARDWLAVRRQKYAKQ
ncbi:MAG TPA: hypothetical protein VIA62_08665 [Thermoanaerobaculia bacterium]|jgi:hypothetical protein|nr:hypothetical protein [Thermoanaerobaculia bacterium]